MYISCFNCLCLQLQINCNMFLEIRNVEWPLLEGTCVILQSRHTQLSTRLFVVIRLFFLLDLGRWIQQIWKESKGCVKKEHFCLPRINTGKGELVYCNVASLGLIIILMMILIILVIICVLSCVALLPCELGMPGNFS